MKERDELMTLIQAAIAFNVSANTLRIAIHRKRLVATKKGRDWFVTPQAVKDWRDNKPHRPGRYKIRA